MPLGVHALMENADNLKRAIRRQPVEDHMRSDRQFEVAIADIDRPAAFRAGRQRFEARDEALMVFVGLLRRPRASREKPDIFKIGFSERECHVVTA